MGSFMVTQKSGKVPSSSTANFIYRHEGMIRFVTVPVIHGAARDRPVLDQAFLFPCPPVRKGVAALYLVARSRGAPDKVLRKVQAIPGQSASSILQQGQSSSRMTFSLWGVTLRGGSYNPQGHPE